VEEDAKLTEAVTELGGNKRTLVAVLVPTRTNLQCRQRWKTSLDPEVNKGKWTVEEDVKLTDAVTEHGCDDWVAVAALVPGRTNLQCHQRYWTPASRTAAGKWKKTQH
jgi:myb proto-oncogene protein